LSTEEYHRQEDARSGRRRIPIGGSWLGILYGGLTRDVLGKTVDALFASPVHVNERGNMVRDGGFKIQDETADIRAYANSM